MKCYKFQYSNEILTKDANHSYYALLSCVFIYTIAYDAVISELKQKNKSNNSTNSHSYSYYVAIFDLLYFINITLII